MHMVVKHACVRTWQMSSYAKTAEEPAQTFGFAAHSRLTLKNMGALHWLLPCWSCASFLMTKP